jgi:hypothetical protein
LKFEKAKSKNQEKFKNQEQTEKKSQRCQIYRFSNHGGEIVVDLQKSEAGIRS